MSEYITYKFVLIGDTRVGKTCIFRKLFNSIFSETMLSTVGVERKTINFDNEEVNLNGKKEIKNFEISIFDTAGQERFRSIPRNYIRGSEGIIIIYDITERKSFENIEIWLKSISENISNDSFLVMLLGNKLDLANGNKNNENKDNEDGDKTDENKDNEDGDKTDENNNNNICRQVSYEEGEKECEKYNFIWGGECSAKEFTDQQFKDLIIDFAKQIYSKVNKSDNNSIKVTKKNNLKKKKKGCC